MMSLPNFEDVENAAERISRYVFRTPVLTSSTLDSLLHGAKCFLKCENFQRGGSFKFRGAFSALSGISSEQQARGVVAFSSGNHAQAVALAGKLLGVSTTIVMPHDAPAIKMKATRSYGGNVVIYNRHTEDRAAIGRDLAERHNLTLIHPYDNRLVIAGQGTATKELIDEVGALDYLFVCVGGGGLISGASLAAKKLSPHCKVFGVEPEKGNDAQMSLKEGRIVQIPLPDTIADGAQTLHIGELTFALMKTHVEAIVTVSDQELVACMAFLAERMKIVVEPTGCLGLAGLLKMVREGLLKVEGCRVGVIISGGNVDLAKFAHLIQQGGFEPLMN